MADQTIDSSTGMDRDLTMQTIADDLIKKADGDYKGFRQAATQQWVDIYYNYIGKYKSNVIPKGEEWRTRIFIKATKVKCLAALSQFMQAKRANQQIIETEALDGNDDAAKRMKEKIQEQLEETKFPQKLDTAGIDKILYGNCWMQSPVIESKETGKWVPDSRFARLAAMLGRQIGSYKFDKKSDPVPGALNRNVFEMYPYQFSEGPQSGEGVFHRPVLTEYDLMDLADKPGFDKDVIAALVKLGEEDVYIDDGRNDKEAARGMMIGSRKGYDLCFYSGKFNVKPLREAGIERWKDVYGYKEIWAWVIKHSSGNKILKVVPAPTVRVKRPFYTSVYERVPYETLGVGIGENIMDSQELINGAVRLFVDAKKLALPQVAVNKSKFTPGQKLAFGLAKIWQFSSGDPKEAIYPFSLTDVSGGLLDLIELAERFADEITQQPKWSAGATDMSNVNKTAAGLGMLMNAQSQVSQLSIESFDDDIIQPVAQSFYDYNMQFDKDPLIKGNMLIKASGLSAVMQKDAMNQAMIQIMTFILNPMVMSSPYALRLLRLIAENARIPNVEKIMPNPDEIQAYMNMTRENALTQLGGVSAPGGPGGAPLGGGVPGVAGPGLDVGGGMP
jgi:hypothetical protein